MDPDCRAEDQSMEDVDPYADLLHTRVDVFVRHPSNRTKWAVS